ncbi:hypothetical protein [Streptosporangium sp. NPDC023615]|uniref:hypothetical protein n=1 Tax=Streptosporangium sp. NPDC023615 TaxID=3154794 RepID=UPI003420BE49
MHPPDVPNDPADQPSRSRPPMNNSTRYLCAGAYLDDRFRHRVLREILDDPYRAVAPSHGGFDLLPVVLHCLRAERLLQIRNAAISILLAGICLLSPLVGGIMLILSLLAAPFTHSRIRRMPLVQRVMSAFCLCFLTFVPLTLVFSIMAIDQSISTLFGRGPTGDDTGTQIIGEPRLSLLLLLCAFAAALGYRVSWYLTLRVTLRPGATAGNIEDAPRFADRLAYADRAQRGNITLYGNEYPFIGAGDVHQSWSIVVELDRLKSEKADPRRGTRPRADLDPVDLHAFVRTRLLEMRDAVEFPGERVERLHISDQLAARGVFTRTEWPNASGPRSWKDQGHPLIDPGTGLPRFSADEETVNTVIRNPQGGIRHYQRVTVTAEAPEIRNGDFQLAPAEDQEVVVSAFIHLAVEGRMLYTQCVVTVLPPVRDDFQIDRLFFLSDSALVAAVFKHAGLKLVADVMFAPGRLARSIYQATRRDRVATNPATFLLYPFGTRLSVRELGASHRTDRFMQLLDTVKYSRIIEQRLTEAVVDYLDSLGVDTGGYRRQAASVINQSIKLDNGSSINGPVAMGDSAKATQNRKGESQ